MMSLIFKSVVLGFGLTQALPPAVSKKDEFIFRNAAEPESLDPHFATGSPDNNIIVQMFEGLMTRDASWSKVVPGQAESYSVSKDQKVYTFKLRKGLKWSDGSPLTAKDFEYSWLRAINPNTMASYSYWLTDNVVGAAEYNKQPTPENAAKVGVKAVDDLTFQVTLKAPLGYFIQLTAESLMFPVKREVVEKHKERWTRPENIVSNGPYVLKEWRINDRIVLEKNPNHWDAKNIQINRIVARPVDDRQTGVNLFRQGQLDWSGQNGAPNALVPSFRNDPNFRTHPGFITYFYRFNTTRGPLKDKRVRQALSLAIDRQSIVNNVTRGGETPAFSFVSPKTGDYKVPQTFITANHAENLKRAKALLAEAGFPEGKGFPTLNLLYNTDENHKRIAQAVVQMWNRDLGITVRPFNQEWKVYLKSQTALDYDISRSGWQGDYPDPATFLELFLSGSGNNQTGWKNADYDVGFAKAVAIQDPAKRNVEFNRIEKLLIEEAPIAPIYFYTNFGFLRPEVVGFVPNPVDRPLIRYYSKK